MSFKNCKWCSGKGCVACPAERQKDEKAKTERLKNWRPPTEAQLESTLDIAKQLDSEIDEEKFKAAIKTPQPIATIKLDDDGDLELANKFLGADVLKNIQNHDDLLKQAEMLRLAQKE